MHSAIARLWVVVYPVSPRDARISLQILRPASPGEVILMIDPSDDLSNSTLWRATLAARPDDEFSNQRERLRTAFLRFRDHAADLATEIRRDLPQLTVHDVTHLDGLWDIASIIVGDGYSLTPVEGFVLGGAILLHDLAMSIAATEGGYAAILNDPRWADL